MTAYSPVMEKLSIKEYLFDSNLFLYDRYTTLTEGAAMSNVLTLDPPLTEEVPSHRRLRELSSVLALLFGSILMLYALFAAAIIGTGLLMPDHIVIGARGLSFTLGRLPPLYPGAVRLSELPFITHLAGAIGLIVQMAPVFFIFQHLRGLFALYAEGTVFARANAVHLKRTGMWLIAYPFTILIANTLFLLAGGQDRASWLHISEIQAPILGLIVFAIAHVMEFGHDIEQEKDSFV
jgi:hypothetical protein